MSLNREHFVVPENFTIRPGTIDYGKDYEVKMAALLSLRCVGHNMVHNMWLVMNAKDCGAFDDIVLYVQTQGGNNITYLIQLKHRMEPTDIGAREFKAKKGDFLLKKYYDTVVQIKNATAKEGVIESEIIDHLQRNRDTTVFILFTNRGTTCNDFLKVVDKKSAVDNTWLLYQIVDTNGIVSSFDYEKLDFKFEENCKSYMERFFLFTKQISVSKLDAAIEVAIENLIKPLKLQKNICNELVQKYVLFVNSWSKGELGGYYALTKSHIFKILLEHIFTSHKVKIKIPEADYIYDSAWSKIIEDKAVTVIESDDVVTEFLNMYISSAVKDYCKNSENKNLWKRHPDVISKQILRTVRRSKNIKFCDAYECLWKNGEIPLLLTATNSQDVSNILCTLNLFQEIFRIILVVKDTTKLTNTDNSNNMFSSLKNLNREQRIQILKNPVQLQGRCSINLLDFVTEELSHLFSVKDIIYILSHKFNVGDKCLDLPETFVKRSLVKVLLKPEVLEKVISDIFVIKCNCSYDLKTVLAKYKLYFKDSEVVHWDDVQGNFECLEPRIIVLGEENNLEQTNTYGLTKDKPIHYLTLHEEGGLEWIDSFSSIKNIMGFRINSSFSNLEIEITDKARKNFKSKTILISACPGMGKSILMDYVALHASTDVWVLRINLFEHTDYYRRENCEDSHTEPSKHLQYFANKILKDQKRESSLVRIVFEKYLNSKKVLLLLDGFDEIPINCQAKASKMIKSLRDSNYSMYLTTRPILKIHLEELLNTFAVTINPFTRNDQVTFLTKYFAGAANLFHVTTDNVQKLVKVFVNKLLKLTRQNLNDQDQDFTGVPLQTKLLAEVFVEECERFIKTGYFKNVHFDLLYLYKHFIEQKVKIVCAKFGNSSDDMLYHYKTYRTFYALRLLFPKQDLEELNLEERLKQLLQFFPDTLQQLQKDGIVVAERQSNVTFVHRSFAEYLAAEWLSENIKTENREIVNILIKRTFEPSFATVRNIFDRILAKDCPLHLAVINRQLDIAKEIVSDNKSALIKTDKGNRSLLHLIAAWGVHHPFSIESGRALKSLYQMVAKDSMIEMLKLIPHEKLTSSKDDLLNYTQLDYAILSGSLNVADAICARLNNVNQCISLTDININYSFYFEHFPYGSLGSVLIKHSVATEVYNTIRQRKQFNSEDNELHYEVINGNVQRTSLLLSLGKNINQIDVNGFTPLHLTAMFGQPLLAHLLVSNEAVVDIKDNSGKTPLHWATAMGELNIVMLLISSNKADVNAQDSNGMSSLHYAVVVHTSDQIEILSVLLKSEASITTKDNYGKTPLHYALHYTQIQALKLLLDFGTCINVRPEPCSSVSGNEDSHLDYLSDILSSRDSDGGTVLHWAADKGLANIVSLFLSYGAHVNIEDNDGRTAVHWAAERGHTDIVILLLFHGANVNARDTSGRTPLFLATKNGNVDTVKLLLERGAFAKDKDSYNMSALHWAACTGNTDVVNLLLSKEKGESLDEKNNDGSTALISAAKDGYTAIVNLLLRTGADIEAADKQSMNALHWAAWSGNLDAVEFLMSEGAELEVKDIFDRTPLICAAHNGHTPVVTALLAKGANVETKDDQGMNALNWSACNGHTDATSVLMGKGGAKLEMKSNHGRTALINAANSGHVEIVNSLISKGADIEEKDNEGMTALHCAVCKGHVETVDLLLVRGADLEAKSNYEKTGLIYAADFGHTAVLALLLTKGAEIKARDNENMSALTWAAHSGHIDAVNLLVATGADLEIKNKHGRTAVVCAAQNGHTAVVNLLMSKGANIEAQDNQGMSALHWAAYNNYVDMVNLLLTKGLSVNLKDANGRTPLVHAAHNGYQVLLSLLLFKGAEVNEKDNEDMTALHWASLQGHLEVVNLLLSKGVNLETRDKYGRTALMCAVANCHLSTAGLLLVKGADTEVVDEENKTALHFAALMGCKVIAEVLLAIGANLEAKDRNGRTPLIYAATRGDLDTVALFLSQGANAELQDKEGLTALDWAKRNCKESVALFLQKQTNTVIQNL